MSLGATLFLLAILYGLSKGAFEVYQVIARQN